MTRRELNERIAEVTTLKREGFHYDFHEARAELYCDLLREQQESAMRSGAFGGVLAVSLQQQSLALAALEGPSG